MDAAWEAVIRIGSGMWRCNMFSEEHASCRTVNSFIHADFA